MTVHKGRLQWGPQFRTWNSGPGNQDLDIRTFSGPIQDQDQVPNSGPHCMSWIVLIGTLFKLNCLLPAATLVQQSAHIGPSFTNTDDSHRDRVLLSDRRWCVCIWLIEFYNWINGQSTGFIYITFNTNLFRLYWENGWVWKKHPLETLP